MSSSSGSLDYWRKLFRSTGSDIFQVMENAIDVAAADSPDELSARRDRIAQRLFTCRLDRCLGCRNTVQERTAGPEEARDQTVSPEEEDDDDDDDGKLVDVDVHHPVHNSNYSYDEAEALTEEMDEESQIVGEVLRIKSILDHHQEESDCVLFDSLRRLQLMAPSVDTLKATEIGRAVNRLRKHNSKEIRQLVRTLIDGWKLLVDEWVKTVPAIPDNSPDSANPSVLDEEEGLPSPPLDEGALFATHTTSIQLSEIFDGMDDDGNLRNDGAFDKKREIERRPMENHKPLRMQQPFSHPMSPESKVQRREEPKPKLPEAPNSRSKPQGIVKNKLSSTDSGPGRPARLAPEQKGRSYMNPGIQKKNTNAPQDKIKNSEDTSVRAKLEVAKRKLQERYQEAENAKRQRTIQVMELHDLPKQGHLHNNNSRFSSNTKHKSKIRNWASSRR